MPFSFAHITDNHLLHREDELMLGFSPGYAFRRVLQYVGKELAGEIDFVVCGGDLVETPDVESYENAKWMMGLKPGAIVSEPGFIHAEGIESLPVYFLPGNHDDRENFFRALYPEEPIHRLMNATFEHKGIQFICLDLGPEVKGSLGDETLGFLRSRLSDRPVVLLAHHPFVRVGAKWLDQFLAEDLNRFWELLESHHVLGMLSGHVHISYDQDVNGIQVMGTRSTAFPFAPQDEKLICLCPPHIRVVTIEDSILTTRLIEVPLD